MPYRRRTWIACALCGAGIFLASFALRPFDEDVGRALVGTRGLVTLAGGFAFLGGISFLGPASLVAGGVLALKRRWWGAIRVGSVVIAADMAARAVKLVFARPRPEYALVEAGGFSFPSGHATAGAALAVLLAWFATRHLKGRAPVVALLAAAVVWAAAVAGSRVILGVHYPSDVVGGIGFGMTIAGGLLAASIHVERHLARAPTSAPASQ